MQSFCCEMLQKGVVGLSMPSYKSCLFSTLSAFEKKIVLPTSIMEHSNAIFLLNFAEKSYRWVKHIFLQKLPFFDFVSI